MDIIPEPLHCVQYHDYLETLITMEKDKTLPIVVRSVSKFIRSRVDKHHFKECFNHSSIF